MENKKVIPTHASILNIVQQEIEKNSAVERKKEFDLLKKIVSLEEQQKNLYQEMSYLRQDFLTNQNNISENLQSLQSQSKNLVEGMNKYLTSTTEEMNKRFEKILESNEKKSESLTEEMNKRFEKILESNEKKSESLQNQINKQAENSQIQLDEKIAEMNKNHEESIDKINSLGKTFNWLSVIGFIMIGGLIVALKFLF